VNICTLKGEEKNKTKISEEIDGTKMEAEKCMQKGYAWSIKIIIQISFHMSDYSIY